MAGPRRLESAEEEGEREKERALVLEHLMTPSSSSYRHAVTLYVLLVSCLQITAPVRVDCVKSSPPPLGS